MRRDLLGYSLFFVVGLCFAFSASLPDKDRGELAKDWFSLDPSDISTVTFKEEKYAVNLEKKPFGYWVNVEEERVQKDKTEKNTMNFRANETVNDLDGAMKPFQALRVIGDASKVDLKEFGLTEKTSDWVIQTTKGKKYEFSVGKRSYGARDYFALDRDRQQVILIAGQPIELLRNAKSRLFERDVTKAEEEKIRRAVITTDRGKLEWDHSDRDQAGNLEWKDKKAGATSQVSYKNWMDKVLRLKVLRYADADEVQQLQGVAPSVTVELFDERGQAIDKIMLKKFKSPKDTNPQTASEYWIDSTYLGVPTQINPARVQPIEQDLATLIGK